MVRLTSSNLWGGIAVFLIICCFCTLPVQAKYGGGTGEPNDPYLIFDVNQMNAIGAEPNDWDKCFKLVADIDLGDFTGTVFNIIGNDVNAFSGVFDGSGHTISNFTYDSNGVGYIELFGYVDDRNAEIKNPGLTDPNVTPGSASRVGSLVGSLIEGTIANCYVEGAGLVGYNYGTITNSYSTGSVSGGGSGLVGINYGTITNCYSTGSVSGDGDVGGLVGYNFGTIANCYSTGSVSGGDYVGGLVGFNTGTITNCYFTGSVSGGNYVGGLVGLNYEATITNCYTIVEVSGEYAVGGLVGDGYWGGITDCSATASVTGDWAVGGLVGRTHHTSISNCYSAVDVTGYSSIGGLVGNARPGTISNCYSEGIVSGIEDVGGLVGAGGGSIVNSYATAGVSGTTNVGGLMGSNRSGITNCYSTGSVTGDSPVGGLVGYNWSHGSIWNCYSTGSVSGDYVGGLVGYNDGGEITESFWDIEASGQTTSSYGGTGKTTGDMQMQITFTDAGWDFIGETINGSGDIWRLCVDGAGYPELNWQFLPGDFLCPDRVDFIDYSFFASHWLEEKCRASNDCNGTDLDRLGTVEINDLAVFVGNWLAGRPPGQASNPNPTDGATGVDMGTDLNWTLGDWAALHEVYFGTDPCALPLVATQPAGENSYDPPGDLILGATYYWRIDVVGTYGTITGTVWSFTTIRGQAHTPSPADGVVIPGYEYEYPAGSGNWYVCAELIFGEGPTAVSHTGYFSEDYSDVAGRVQDANLGPPPYGSTPGHETTYYVGDPIVAPATESLVRGMTYYWCVDEFDGDTTYSGEIWSFRVMPVEVWGPEPGDGATDVPADPNLTLSWNPGHAEGENCEITYDIYVGSDQSEIETSTTPIANVETTSYPVIGLDPDTTYYWRIDTRKMLITPPHTVDIIPGNLWGFTTASPVISSRYRIQPSVGSIYGRTFAHLTTLPERSRSTSSRCPVPLPRPISIGSIRIREEHPPNHKALIPP